MLSTHKILLHKLQLVVLAFLVGELVLVRGALARMEVTIALPVSPLPVPLASYPFGVASLVVMAVLGTSWSSVPTGCFLPTWAPCQPTMSPFGYPRVHRIMPQKQRGLLPSITFRENTQRCDYATHLITSLFPCYDKHFPWAEESNTTMW